MPDQKQTSYRLVSSHVPPSTRSSFYLSIVRDFREMDEESVLVADTGKKPMTLWQGLRKAVEAEGAEDVRVAQRGEETYLVRE